MNTGKISRGIILCLTYLISTEAYSSNIGYAAIGGISAIAGGAIYGHLILPWIGNKHKEAERVRAAANHDKEQERLRAYYHIIQARYSAENITTKSSHELAEYKNQLLGDLAELATAIGFDWDNPGEKESLIAFSHYLKDQELQIGRLVAFKIGQETHDYYKDEFTLLDKNNTSEPGKLSKIIYEKCGDTPYKYTSYKTSLSETIMHCKQVKAPEETIQALENLSKNINYLFAQALDQERNSRQEADKQEKLFNAELDNKYAIKDFYRDAQHHVQQASNTVSHFSEEMDRQCRAQKTVLDSCTAMLHSILNMFGALNMHSEQQIERVVHEVRQEGHITRDAVRTAVNENNSKTERKIGAVERKAEAASKQAAEAKKIANATLPPLPPAYNPNFHPESSTPPYDGSGDGSPSAPPQE